MYCWDAYDHLFRACYNNNQFYCHYYIDKEFKIPYSLTPLPERFSSAFSSSLSGTVISPTPVVTQGNQAAQMILFIY